MAAYGMTYEETGGLPASRFEQIWKAYAIRTSLEKLDREYDRQRTAIQSGFGEPERVRELLEELHDAYLAERDAISTGKAFQPEEREFVDELWWKKPDDEPAKAETEYVQDKWW